MHYIQMQVIDTPEPEKTWLILNDNVGVGNLCKVEKSKVVGNDNDNEDDKEGIYNIENNITTTRIPDQTEKPQEVKFLEVVSFCA